MTKAILFLTIAVSSISHAGTILSAKLDSAGKNIIVEGRTGGGCGKHDFSLKIGGCLESLPVKCGADLIEKTDDICEAIIPFSAVLSLKQYGLNDPYYKGGKLTISGDDKSSATVTLP